jgi:hypothetical protein
MADKNVGSCVLLRNFWATISFAMTLSHNPLSKLLALYVSEIYILHSARTIPESLEKFFL